MLYLRIVRKIGGKNNLASFFWWFLIISTTIFVKFEANYSAKPISSICRQFVDIMELRLAAARWLRGFGTPPPPPVSPPLLAGWLARPWKTAKIRSAQLYRLFSRMVWVWGWVWVGHLSRTPLPHTPSCLAFGTSHKDHPYCNIYPKARFQRTLTSPTPHSATCNPTQSHTPFGSEHSNLDSCHGKQACHRAPHLQKELFCFTTQFYHTLHGQVTSS